MIEICSSKNKFIKQINVLKNKRERDKDKLFVLEGERLVSEIPFDWNVEYYALSDEYLRKIGMCEIEKKFSRADVLVVENRLFEKISDTVSPQGIMAVCRQKQFDEKRLFEKENPFFVMLERLCDPGNLGTIIRSADAAGADAVFLSEGSVDLYNGKVIRSTMGSIFHMPIIQNVNFSDMILYMRKMGISIFAAHLKGNVYPYDVDLRKGCAILIGNEANGLSESVSEMADMLVKLPMLGKAESINASAAGSIFIYEAVRQRIER